MQWGSSRCETVCTCNFIRNCRWCRMHPVAWLWVGRRWGPGEFSHATAKSHSKLNGIEYSFGFWHYSLNMVDCLHHLLLFIDSGIFHRIIKTPWTSSQWGAWYQILAKCAVYYILAFLAWNCSFTPTVCVCVCVSGGFRIYFPQMTSSIVLTTPKSTFLHKNTSLSHKAWKSVQRFDLGALPSPT